MILYAPQGISTDLRWSVQPNQVAGVGMPMSVVARERDSDYTLPCIKNAITGCLSEAATPQASPTRNSSIARQQSVHS